MRRFILTVALTMALAAPVAASAHAPGDPWERVNRQIYKFNAGVDRLFIRPLSKFTSGLTPGPIGRAIRNFLVNLNEPVVIVNDLLQARPGPAIRSAVRLVVNTTIGGLGAIDVAKALGDPMHPNGFGDTLGRWQAPPGPYLVLPVFGPSSVRDLFGTLVDDATLPLQSVNYPYRTEVDITVNIVGGLNEREAVAVDLDTLLEGAADPYATLRSSYLQSREAQIRGQKALPVLEDIDETPPGPAAAAVDTKDAPQPAGAPPPAASPQSVAAPEITPEAVPAPGSQGAPPPAPATPAGPEPHSPGPAPA